VAWIDNHCHLRVDDDGAIADARDAGVARLITVGTDLEHSLIAVRVAEANADVWATAGVHPHDATQGLDGIAALLTHPKVVAVGEAGLDYYYDHSPRDVQQSVFAAQIALANAHDLPLVIHTRDAWEDTFRILDREGTPRRTVFHCFTGGPDEADGALARGALLSISGIVTFKSATDVREAIARAPIDRLLVETDSPYLAPVPHRGKPNRPALVPLIGAAVATLKGCTVAEFETVTWSNTCSFYGLDPQVG
jgi:TatD DNase family protein